MRDARVVALVPAHDEAAAIVGTVSAIRGIEGITRVIVVDDASADGTGALAAEAGAEVVTLPENRGKGAALNAGLTALGEDYDVLLLLDADLGPSASEAAALVEPVLAREADMTVGVLPKPPGSGGFGLVKGLARCGIFVLGRGFRARAPLSGQRALDPAAVAACTPFARRYGVETALTVRARRAGLVVTEVPVAMSHAATGRDASGFAHRARQFVDVALTLLGLVFAPRRPRS
ncbi:MAG: glycosyltransferase [Actinobacteria bacterium]|nr:MAG: glycosyltransferase [Actinomycetota bacterium]